jgi:ATP-dependent helicase/nuclease subunit B
VSHLEPNDSILKLAAAYTLQQFADQLPDLSQLVILLPGSDTAYQFDLSLGQALNAPQAIIPPWTGTLRQWFQQHVPPVHPEYALINDYARQCLFVDALQDYPDLFKEQNQWQVTQSLLSLFNELSLSQCKIFEQKSRLDDVLHQAYGLAPDTESNSSPESSPGTYEHLNQESKLVYTLWHAWRQQLEDNQCYDQTTAYISRLNNWQEHIRENIQFLVVDDSSLEPVEKQFIDLMIAHDRCRILDPARLQHDAIMASGSQNSENSLRRAFFTQCFTRDTSTGTDAGINTETMKQRALTLQSQPDILDARPYATYLASNDEDQVQAIDFHIRHRLLAGDNQIAIISEDRKLSRRLRAMLERSGIELKDQAGWSLATTQAATIIERWLECIEDDFNAFPLLDVLKSPFFNPALSDDGTPGRPLTNESRQALKNNVYRLENDIVFHENISSNLKQYKETMRRRLKRLGHWPASSYDDLQQLLDYIDSTAAVLSALYKKSAPLKQSGQRQPEQQKGQRIALSDFIHSLKNSLQKLGVLDAYAADSAGTTLLHLFDQLVAGVEYADPELSWRDCRLWLGMALESQHFSPPTNQSVVRLMTLDQARNLQFDCIVIAGCEPQHFPGTASGSPVFNQAVRASLGLKTWEQAYRQRLGYFIQSMLSAPDVLITACHLEKGEEKPVSPWLEMMNRFFMLVYGKSPVDHLLHQRIKPGSASPEAEFDTALPSPPVRPSLPLPAELIPERVSASACQRLVNCPYQFYAADGLRLKPPEEISTELRKSDYGERVHRILQLFHCSDPDNVQANNDAFNQDITEASRGLAEAHLKALSERIFLKDLEDNVLHRSWLFRWLKHIPAYIDWQIRQQADWAILACEQNLETTLSSDQYTMALYGRLDRIDQKRTAQDDAKQRANRNIIDYKTGKIASKTDVEDGEDVQLATYALLDEQAHTIQYLSIDNSDLRVRTAASISDDDLVAIREQHRKRMLEINRMIHQQQPLTAWGDDGTCQYCRFSGLCRKRHWQTS